MPRNPESPFMKPISDDMFVAYMHWTWSMASPRRNKCHFSPKTVLVLYRERTKRGRLPGNAHSFSAPKEKEKWRVPKCSGECTEWCLALNMFSHWTWSPLSGLRPARPGRARLGMTLEPLLWLHCSMSGRCLLDLRQSW